MVEPILHLVIPILFLLAFKPKIGKKLIFGLAILTILPDFDFIIGHRSLFHNVFFVLIVSFIVYLMFRFVINKGNIEKGTENKNAFYLSLYYLFFHLFLDMSKPGIPFFYPISNKLFGFNFNLIIRSFGLGGIPSIETQTNIFTKPLIEATIAQDIWVITTFGLILLAVSLIFIAITFINNKNS